MGFKSGKLTRKQMDEIGISLKNLYTPPSSLPVLMDRGHYDRMKRVIVAAREYWEYMTSEKPFHTSLEMELKAALEDAKNV